MIIRKFSKESGHKENEDYTFCLTDFWAKTIDDKSTPGASLMSHAAATASIFYEWEKEKSNSFRSNFNSLLNTMPFLCAVHDVGKIAPDFQIKSSVWASRFPLPNYDSMRHPYQGNHCEYSRETIHRIFNDVALSNAVAAHHGIFSFAKSLSKNPSAWQNYREAFVEWAKLNFGIPELCLSQKSLWILASGIITLCDWIASDETFFPPTIEFDVDSAKKNSKKIFSGETPPIIFGGSFKKKPYDTIFQFKLNQLQENALKICKDRGTYLIESETGSGKTEAALLMAYKLISEGKASGIYFALPTKLTSEMICIRLRTFVNSLSENPQKTKLIHSTSWLENIISNFNEDKSEWFNSSKRALIYPFGVGTIDQALMAVLPVKHMFLRNAALADKVVIIDEVHSYDTYTGSLIDRLVSRLSDIGSTSIILSATLSNSRRRQFAYNKKTPEYPFISAVYSDGKGDVINLKKECEKTYEISTSSADDARCHALDSARKGLCVLYVCNTVNECQQTYKFIEDAKIANEYDFDVGILHSRFPKFLRDKIETKWMNVLGKDRKHRLKNGCILVSTQIVEQSVDIDADIIYTELCPIDMLIQRMGRCFRHNASRSINVTSPKIEVIFNDIKNIDFSDNSLDSIKKIKSILGPSEKIYYPYILLKTALVIDKLKNITIPNDIEELLCKVYDSDATTPLGRALYKELSDMNEKLSHIADSVSNRIDMAVDDEHIETRYGDVETRECLLVKELADGTIQMLNDCIVDISSQAGRAEVLKNAKLVVENSVKLPFWAIKDLCETGSLAEKAKYFFKKKNLEIINIDVNNKKCIAGKYEICFSYGHGVGIHSLSDIKDNTVISKFEKFCENNENI